ncbi:MAG TPA: J domain-containing protein [Devosia sp.]|nr:J domain-containing protein [Devosia sp.]
MKSGAKACVSFSSILSRIPIAKPFRFLLICRPCFFGVHRYPAPRTKRHRHQPIANPNYRNSPLTSNLFSSIRIKPRQRTSEKPEGPVCEWDGCDKPGTKKAPKGKAAEGEFYHFCLAHVRQYNKTFNYFAGMDDSAVAAEIRQQQSTGGRPTWQQGTNGAARTRTGPNPGPAHQHRPADKRFADPLNLFARVARNQGRRPLTKRELRMMETDRQAFEVLGFTTRVDADELKKAYKALVKLHHPDANGGDRGTEDRLRAIIAAYNHLKSKGFAG